MGFFFKKRPSNSGVRYGAVRLYVCRVSCSTLVGFCLLALQKQGSDSKRPSHLGEPTAPRSKLLISLWNQRDVINSWVGSVYLYIYVFIYVASHIAMQLCNSSAAIGFLLLGVF